MRRVIALVTTLLAVTVLAGCGLLPGRTVTMAQLLAGEEFDALNAGVTTGSDLPTELIFTMGNGHADSLADQDFIAQTWKDLVSLEVSSKAENAAVADDGSVAFTFQWADGQGYTFGFQNTDYFVGQDLRPYQLRDSSQMGSLLTSLISHLDERDAIAEAASDRIDLLNGSTFSWDGNGDGVDETYAFRYYDNGDEAPNAIELTSVSEWAESAWFDNAYSIVELREDQDDWGPYLHVVYTYGDYWSHDATAEVVVRLEEGALVTYDVVGE